MGENIEITKRDIFRFDGDKPTAVNLEHVTMINIEKNRLTLSFQMGSLSLDLSDEGKAKEVFEKLIDIWASG
jgi:hypothetical protein